MTNGDAPSNESDPAVQPDKELDRQTQPVDAEGPPRLPFPVVGIGASAGGLEAISEFLSAVRLDSGMAYVFIQHLPPAGESMLVEILAKRTAIPVHEVEDKMPVEADHLYVIRPGCTLTIKDGLLHLGERLAKAMHNRPVDDFFKSLAEEQRERGIAIVLSGMGSNGSAGAQAVKAVGGLCIAQDPDTTAYPSMPRHLIDAGYADYVLRPQDIPDVLLAYAGHPYAKGQREDKAVMAKRDQQHLREILAVLRTRTRHDFNGYKKPTVLRRVQRRMGLSRLTKLGEYAKALRQSPSEVSALADDLLIHVTGFFRDAAAWEALRRQVVVPLIAAREQDAAVRAWVTACSSGEEAYTLAMLLVEEAERAGKHLDIKVFATDMAERTLQNARNGVYPGGIESEIEPRRLERFFQREDAVYRVRQDLRERVVFAPQNILQDPPFSRLDIVSCRNLLIYLEPQVQARVMGLLHFGLREGGALFLGTSETVGSDDLFEPIDKKAKIYRRVGPTRHGSIDFPLPRAEHPVRLEGSEEPGDLRPRSAPRPSLAQITQRTLLERHLPAAVLIDRDHRVLYFQGDTRPFLEQPTGEPTRDLMVLAREGVRGAVRIAVQRSAAENAVAIVRDGWVETAPGRRGRLVVTASLAADKGSPDLFVVSFELLNDIADEQPADIAEGSDQTDQLRRMRDELQSTVEELQTSNEELKASHEEATSVNEELQSTNEELETSKEEMQSLNEELSTVNAQLQAKMEEHQAALNDLASLLSSTDIAVLFLDTQFRIRRFTPMVKELLELIASDIGRPLNDLARKFEDPDLLSDAETVLERLSSVEKVVAAEGSRWYLRRITPYRTADNRIDGVVVAFIDISARRHAETALRASEEQFRRAIEEAPIPIIMQAEGGQVLQISRTWTELTGYVLADVPTADAWVTKAYGPGADAVRARMHELFKGDRKALNLEFVIRTRSGQERHWSFSASSPGTLSDGRRYIVGMALDVTERNQAEAALRVSEARLKRMVNVNGVGFMIFDIASGVLIDANDAFLEMTGYDRSQVEAREITWRTMTPPEYIDASLEQLSKFAQMDRIGPYEKEYLRSDGSRFWMLFAGAGIGEGKVVEYCVDVSDRKRAEAALRESEERFRIAVAAAHMGFWDWNVAADQAEWEPVHNRMLGLPENQKTGTAEEFFARVHPEDRSELERKLRDSVDTRSDFSAEFRAVHPDGTVRWIAGHGRCAFDASGRVIRMIGGVLDVTARRVAEEAMQAARETAEQANRMKDEFLATLSHELRTPLSAILLWSKMLGSERSRDQLNEGLTAIRSGAEAQKELLEDLLDVSRIASGKLRMQLREVDLATIVQDAVETIAPTAEAKGVEVVSDLRKNIGQVRADPDRLRQVAWNLLTNAVKFTPVGGRVDVSLIRRDGTVELVVADNGRGIAPDFLPHVFERFRQAEAVHTRTQGGLGLGLAIVKQLVELHGGTATAESGGINQGTTFTVELPLPKLRKGRPDRGGLVPAELTVELAGRTVLLVEDDDETRKAVATLLKGVGMRVNGVSSAAAAWSAYETETPDLLISDIGLPEEDGHSLITRIRAREAATQNSPTPAVALTAFAGESDKRRAIEAGFQIHIAKPADPDELLTALKAVLRQS